MKGTTFAIELKAIFSKIYINEKQYKFIKENINELEEKIKPETPERKENLEELPLGKILERFEWLKKFESLVGSWMYFYRIRMLIAKRR
jgi:hypothetical protein